MDCCWSAASTRGSTFASSLGIVDLSEGETWIGSASRAFQCQQDTPAGTDQCEEPVERDIMAKHQARIGSALPTLCSGLRRQRLSVDCLILSVSAAWRRLRCWDAAIAQRRSRIPLAPSKPYSELPVTGVLLE